MQLSAVGEQFGSGQEAPVRTQELVSPNAKLLSSEHELDETAAELKAAELDITSHSEETQPERLDMRPRSCRRPMRDFYH